MKTIEIEALKQLRKNNREEEITKFGKLISFRPVVERNRKKYCRKNMKKISLED